MTDIPQTTAEWLWKAVTLLLGLVGSLVAVIVAILGREVLSLRARMHALRGATDGLLGLDNLRVEQIGHLIKCHERLEKELSRIEDKIDVLTGRLH
jgi:hypothetical protein